MIGTIVQHKTYMLSIAGALVALAAIGTAGYAGSADTAASTTPVPCEVVAVASGGGTSLEAIYNAQGPASGTYQFSVKTTGGAGSTNINQGGGFSAQSAGPISLGRVTVSTASNYDITLTVDVGGQTFKCLNPDGRWI